MWKISGDSILVLSVVTYKLIQSANAQLGPHVSAAQNLIVNYGGSINQVPRIYSLRTRCHCDYPNHQSVLSNSGGRYIVVPTKTILSHLYVYTNCIPTSDRFTTGVR